MQGVRPSDTVVAEHLDAEALYRAHATFVARFLLRLGARSDDVPDLVQEVFLVAHRRGGFTVGPAKPTTWLAEIAFRVSSDRRKKQNRRLEDAATDTVALTPSSRTSPGEQTQARQALERVQQALESLTPEKRAVFILYELEGQPCDVIAAGMNIPVGTVYSRLHAARKEFARAHAKLIADPPKAGQNVGPSPVAEAGA